MRRYMGCDVLMDHEGEESRYSSNHLCNCLVLYPLEADISSRLILPDTHFLNQQNLFDCEMSFLLAENSNLQ
ncbi:MAG: hypothetical protein MJY91_01400 [Bacteroidales bacterium]|nr:hypothetical protein [Bacteroidales bacterium]